MWKYAGRTFLYFFGLIALFYIVDRIIYYFLEMSDVFLTIIIIGGIIAIWLILSDIIGKRLNKKDE